MDADDDAGAGGECSPATEGSRYAHYLDHWRERFGAERVLVALYDDLENAPQTFLDTICAFIGIAPIPLEGSPLLGKRVNSVTRGPRIALLAERAWRLRRWLEARKAVAAITILRKAGVWRFSFRGGGVGPLDPALDRKLRERFLPEVEAIEKMLGRDLSDWKKPGRDGRFAYRGELALRNVPQARLTIGRFRGTADAAKIGAPGNGGSARVQRGHGNELARRSRRADGSGEQELIANENARGADVGRLPRFLLVGPPRTGTTWLHGVLYHRACLPERTKETHFFDMFYHKGLDWYRASSGTPPMKR